MPIVQIEMLEGRPIEQKKDMAEKVTQAIAESLQVAPESVRIIIREMSRENFAVAGKLSI